MDENGDGVLDREEIEHCVRNLGFPFEEVSLFPFAISPAFHAMSVWVKIPRQRSLMHQTARDKTLTGCLFNSARDGRLYETRRRKQ